MKLCYLFIFIFPVLSFAQSSQKLEWVNGKVVQQDLFINGEFFVEFIAKNNNDTPVVLSGAVYENGCHKECCLANSLPPILPGESQSVSVRCEFPKSSLGSMRNVGLPISNSLGTMDIISVRGFVKDPKDSSELVIFVEDDILSSLKEKECYQSWITQLEKEDYKVNVVGVEDSNRNEDFYIDQLKKSPAIKGGIFLGEFAIPAHTLSILKPKEGNLVNNNMSNVQEKVQTNVNMMNPNEQMPRWGIGDIDYYKNLSHWIGHISFQTDMLLDPGVENKEMIESQVNKDYSDHYCEYLKANVEYRTCDKKKSLNVLGFVDDDWKDNEDYFGFKCLSTSCHILDTYSDLSLIDTATEGPADFCQLSIHSKAGYHGLSTGEFVDTEQIQSMSADVKFYNLQACHAGHCTPGASNLAQAYLSNSTTLGVIAHTKTSLSMDDKKIYEFLKQKKTYGEAILEFMKHQITESRPGQSNVYPNDITWNAGFAFYGDPTLDLHGCKGD